MRGESASGSFFQLHPNGEADTAGSSAACDAQADRRGAGGEPIASPNRKSQDRLERYNDNSGRDPSSRTPGRIRERAERCEP
jgi:hypothetical protein